MPMFATSVSETAPHNVQVNATGQIFVENPTYFPPEVIGTPELNARLKDVPAGRLSTGREAASLILYLSSPESNFISGQIFPYAGGWVVRKVVFSAASPGAAHGRHLIAEL